MPTLPRRRARKLVRHPAVITAVATLTVVAGIGYSPMTKHAQTPDPQLHPAGFTSLSVNPFAGQKLYVDPYSPAARAVSMTSDANMRRGLQTVAQGSTADWLGDWIPAKSLTQNVAERSQAITANGSMPVYVLYNIPERDCHSYSSGGASSPAAYRSWIDSFVAGAGSARTAVILEPDALSQLSCLSRSDQATRLSLLRYAVSKLATKSTLATYVDAGHAGWVAPKEMIKRLIAVDIKAARGFSLNVSNYDTTASETTYARQIAPWIGWKRVVIDTSRNGMGPAKGTDSWCNPSGRALGPTPSTATGDRLIDAHLWIKRPGESDGTCNGGPPAGQFWDAYAAGLGMRAAS